MKLKHDRIVKIILSKPLNKKLYKVLSRWDSNNTIFQNCMDCKISEVSARNLINKYKLKFEYLPQWRSRKEYTNVNRRTELKKLLASWDGSKSICENADILGISDQYAYGIVRNYNLPYTTIQKGYLKVKKYGKNRLDGVRKSMIALRESGVTLDKIGQMYGVTRERVRQITL